MSGMKKKEKKKHRAYFLRTIYIFLSFFFLTVSKKHLELFLGGVLFHHPGLLLRLPLLLEPLCQLALVHLRLPVLEVQVPFHLGLRLFVPRRQKYRYSTR